LYGLCGLAVAALFWLVVRDRPPVAPRDGHLPAPPPEDGAAEASPSQTITPPRPPLTFLQQLGLLARTPNMGLFGSVQFGVNLGWVFLVTLLPTYLNEAFGTPLEEIGPMQSTALAIGCLGMIFGGVVTDGLRRRLGPRLGRSVPIAATLGGCA